MQLGQLLQRRTFARLAEDSDFERPARLRHGISPEYPSSRHIFLKNAASANIILRFELSHKFGSNFFQNYADSIDKEGRADYVFEHRMRTACVSPGPHSGAFISRFQRQQEGVCHVQYQLHRLRACGVLLS